MNLITSAFERVAILLRPIGIWLGIIAAVLFVGLFINLGAQTFDSWTMDLGMFWTGGLAVLTYWFKPGKSESDPVEVTPSAARRYGKPMQMYVTIFFLVWFTFLSFITIAHIRNVG